VRLPSSRFSEPIQAAIRIFGSWWDYVSDTQFVCGVSPVFSGFHHIDDIGDGRSYKNTAHCAYPWHIEGPAARRTTTIFLPTVETVEVVVHELAHALHYKLDFEPDPLPVTWYAETNHHEAFGEAVTAHLIPGYAEPVDDPEFAYLVGSL
jgi:hypothetical protein